jgi:hypothetical protein
MLLLGALFALFAGGFWLYCLADVALTPSDEFPRLPKAAWVAVVAGTFVIGAAVWLAVRRPAQLAGAPGLTAGAWPRNPDEPGTSPDIAREHRDRGHPGNELGRNAGPTDEPGQDRASGPAQAVVSPVGPDDDPEFLRSLDQGIRGADVGDDPAAAG